MNKTLLIAASSLTLSLGAVPVSVLGQPAATQPAATADFQGDAEGAAKLEAALQHLAGLERVSVRLTSTMSMQGPGMNHQDTSVDTVALAAPNQLAVRPQPGDDGPGMASTLVSDGQTVWTYVPMLERFTTQDAPDGYAEIDLEVIQMNGPNGMFVQGLTAPGAITEHLGDGVGVAYVGQAELDGEAVDHLRVHLSEEALANLDDQEPPAALMLDVYVSAGAQPWVRKIVPDLQAMFQAAVDNGMMPAEMAQAQVQASVVFSQWDSPDAFDAETFAFAPPDNAEEVDDLFAMGPGMGDQPDAEDMVGQAGPAFTLASLGGGDVSLDDLRGQIVVLDFWATWCPPCVRGLPVISTAVAEYADRGAVFYAVNQQEDAETINAFLEAQDLQGLNVLLDAEGEVGDAYGVSGIPQTVILDRDGNVQAVHVGFGNGSEQLVRDDIQEILDAEQPATN